MNEKSIEQLAEMSGCEVVGDNILLAWHTDDDQEREISRKYWDHDSHYFIYKVNEIKRLYNLPDSRSPCTRIASWCTAYHAQYVCGNCEQFCCVLTNRSMYIDYTENTKGIDCPFCGTYNITERKRVPTTQPRTIHNLTPINQNDTVLYDLLLGIHMLISQCLVDFNQQSIIKSARKTDLQKMPYTEYLQTTEWQTIAAQAKQRSNYRCQICNSPRSLHTHHRTYERRGDELPEDLIVLCAECHELFHTNAKLAEE